VERHQKRCYHLRDLRITALYEAVKINGGFNAAEEFFMKNKKVLLVVLAIALALGMMVVSCDNGGGGNSTPQAKYYAESGTISTTAYDL
jgi:hypothetical protein